MTSEELKRLIDDERAERLTAQVCRHWEVATQRLAELVQDLETDMDTCVDAEVYAAVMRMQSSVMSLMELNKIPSGYLFSEYLDRIAQTVSDTSIRQSVMTLAQRLLGNDFAQQRASFFDLVTQTLAQQSASPIARQETCEQPFSPQQYIFAVCAQHLPPNDLMMVAQLILNKSADDKDEEQEVIMNHLMKMRQTMDDLSGSMGESLQMMLIGLILLMLLPGLLVSVMQKKKDSQALADLFSKELLRVRESTLWWDYWKERRETFRVVNDSLSWKEIMKQEQGKEREELGKVSGGLFAKWTTDRKSFDADFLDAHLSDDALRRFIFHLATLYEIARELEPSTKFGDEQLVNNDLQRVGEAVLQAASMLHSLVADAWFPHYDQMWQELIQNEEIFAHLKVTRKSPHNNLFTARFFCHLVGEMKKRAVFGAHSDNDLAEKLTEKRYVGTFRKNIQEGMGDESENIRNIFDNIYQKYNNLAHQRK